MGVKVFENRVMRNIFGEFDIRRTVLRDVLVFL